MQVIRVNIWLYRYMDCRLFMVYHFCVVEIAYEINQKDRHTQIISKTTYIKNQQNLRYFTSIYVKIIKFFAFKRFMLLLHGFCLIDFTQIYRSTSVLWICIIAILAILRSNDPIMWSSGISVRLSIPHPSASRSLKIRKNIFRRKIKLQLFKLATTYCRKRI